MSSPAATTSGTSARSTPELDRDERILRPINYGETGVPGRGWGVFHAPDGTEVAVINAQGRTYMAQIENPFTMLDALLDDGADELPQVRLVDFHCELTSEKNAFGIHLDGRVSAVCGTHTHVATADERILPRGTGLCQRHRHDRPGLQRHRLRPGHSAAALHQRAADALRGGQRPSAVQRDPDRYRYVDTAGRVSIERISARGGARVSRDVQSRFVEPSGARPPAGR